MTSRAGNDYLKVIDGSATLSHMRHKMPPIV